MSVGIVDDDMIESTESFTIVLSNPQPAGQVVVGIEALTVTISDNDLCEFNTHITHSK